MSQHYAKDPRVDNALRHSIRDGVAYSVMTGAGESYFTAFALYFKATTSQIGLLASLPPLVSSISQLFSAWLSHKNLTRRQVVLVGAMAQVMIWLPLIILPLLMPSYAVTIIIVCVILYHAFGSVIIPQWSSLMGDLVPEHRRGRYFAQRNRFTSISMFIAMILAGIVLQYFKDNEFAVYGFVAIFSVAAIARCVSIYHLSHLVDVNSESLPKEIDLSGNRWRQMKQSRFFHFSVYFTLMQTAVAIGSPFIAVYMLRDLHFSYVEFMSLNAVTVLVQFLTLNTWGRISDSFGNRLILTVTGFSIPLIPALWLLSYNFWYLTVVQVLSGMVWAGFNLSAANFLYDLIPAPKRSTYLAVHNIMTNTGIFCGALLGGFVGSIVPQTLHIAGQTYQLHSTILGVLFLSFLLRMVVALIFLPRLKEVRDVQAMTVTQLIFRATRFNALSGMIYDILSSVRRNGVSEKSKAKE